MRIQICLKQVQSIIIGFLLLHGSMLAVRRLPTSMLRPPRLTVVIVVDSFGYHYIQKLMPYLNCGLKTLMDKGVVYTNAYWPHGTPSTGPGHAALNTGVYGKDSGIIANSWFDKKGHKIECDDDEAQVAAVLAPDGFYNYGKSPKNIMVSGVSDSLAMQSQPCAKTKVFGISLKSRAAIGMVGKDRSNQPFWFDDTTGCMTSSKYYCDTLPDWIVKFNKTCHIPDLTKLTWDLLYPEDSEYYCFDGIKLKGAARKHLDLINSANTQVQSKKELLDLFEKTPAANQMLFDCAKACIKENLDCNRDERMLLWLSLSPLDKLAHIDGPASLKVIDLIYKLDCQLQKFIRFVDKQVIRSDVVYILTADHGMGPIPEYIQEQGYPAYRVDSHTIEKKIDDAIVQKLGKAIHAHIKTPHLYFSHEFDLLSYAQQQEALKVAKSVLLEQKCIKNAWTDRELDRLNVDDGQIESFFKYQRYPGRSGHILIQTAPFGQLSKYQGGTTHEGPYEVNTHVPLIIYRHKFFEHKMVNTRVSMLQLANTMAQILHIPKAAASTFKLLPGLFPDEQEFVL